MNMNAIDRLWRDLIAENPMTIEITRVRRKFFSITSNRGTNSAVLVLVIIGYAIITLSVFGAKGGLPPSPLVMLQTAAFCFLGPAAMHGTIAGERERRSWDLLLVAPITHAQIVVGKFLGAAVAVGGAALAGLVPIGLAAILYDSSPFIARRTTLNYINLLQSEAVSVSFGLLVCALTILFSARVRRPLAALGTTYGILAVCLIAIPSLLTAELKMDSAAASTILYGHPFFAQSQLMAETYSTAEQSLPSQYYGLPHVLLYLGLTVVMLTWATKTLIFAENDVKFIPRGEKDARS